MAKRESLKVGAIKISWHEGNGEWYRSIGYGWNKGETKLVQRIFYFGRDDALALEAAAAKIAKWKRIKMNWARIAPTIAHLYPGRDVSQPFWIEKAAQPSREQEEVKAVTPVTVHTVKTSRDLYIREREERIGLPNARGLKRGTVNTDIANLDAAIEPLELILPVNSLTYDVIDSVVRHHYGRCDRGEIEQRSALNYCRTFKAWLDWMVDHPKFEWVKPKGIDRLFELGVPAPNVYVPDDDEVKAVLQAAVDRTRLFILLGINCGCTQVDIAAMEPGDLVVIGGERFLWWSREKTTHQNSFKSLHWLFPETVELIDRLRVKGGKGKHLFLAENGRPLQVVKEGSRSTPIYEAFTVAKDNAEITSSLAFKSFRKYGANGVGATPASAVQAAAGPTAQLFDRDNLARLYLGQKLKPPLNSYIKYRQSDFAVLTAALKTFHARLKAGGIISWQPAR